MLVQRGIYMVDLRFGRYGCEEAGLRPCLVVSSDLHNQVNKSCIIVPLTTQTDKAYWAEHRLLQYEDNVMSCAMCEHIREVDKKRFIGDCIAMLEQESFDDIMKCIKEVTLG